MTPVADRTIGQGTVTRLVPTPERTRLSGWGRTCIARGQGRSYGDAAQLAGGTVIATNALDDVIAFDADTGVITVAGGLTLDALLRLVVPFGWFVAVSPGTRHVSIGGAIAADVHGKNHHRLGSFGRHVVSMVVQTGRGVETLDPRYTRAAFWATVGGMGLTAWIDTLNPRHLGRGLVMAGDHARLTDLDPSSSQAAHPLGYATRTAPLPPVDVPLLGPAVGRTFNRLWYRLNRPGSHIETIGHFFHPLDAVTNWNHLYGRRGLVQWQIVAPDSDAGFIDEALHRLARIGAGSFLSVLKRFGDASPGHLSFPIPGWTLAVDIAAATPGLGTPASHDADMTRTEPRSPAMHHPSLQPAGIAVVDTPAPPVAPPPLAQPLPSTLLAPAPRAGGAPSKSPRAAAYEKRRLPLARFVAWCGRNGRRLTRLTTAVAIAGVANLIGIPFVIAVAAATGLVAGSYRWGPLRTGERVRPRRPVHHVVVLAFVALLAATSWSYTGYLEAPGAAPVTIRTADWMRDHWLSPIADRIERYVFEHGQPTNGPVDPSRLPQLSAGANHVDAVAPATSTQPTAPAPTPAMAASPVPTPPVVGPLIDTSLAGEGLWTPNAREVDGAPVTYTTFVRPDPDYTAVVAAAVFIHQSRTHLVYAPGTEEPGGAPWAWRSGIPLDVRPDLVAAFNSGFKFEDTDGGLFTEGRTPYPLVDGQASLVIYADGHTDIGAWGTDLTMTPDVVTVRQSLRLIVSNGAAADGLLTSTNGDWGSHLWQNQYTRRSGIGVTADGNLIFVAGSLMNLESLAHALVQAGAITAMQLDIHSNIPTFNFFEPSDTAAMVAGTKLLPDMPRPADRYLAPDQRDFFALLTGSAPADGTAAR